MRLLLLRYCCCCCYCCCYCCLCCTLRQEIKGSKTEGAGLLFVESLGVVPLALREAAFKQASAEGSLTQRGDADAPRVIKQVRAPPPLRPPSPPLYRIGASPPRFRRSTPSRRIAR